MKLTHDLKVKKFRFFNMCKTWGRLRIRISISMESRIQIRIGINIMPILFEITLLNPANNLDPDKRSRRARKKKTKTRIFKWCGAVLMSYPEAWSQFSLDHFKSKRSNASPTVSQ
jgi:hypothetical protein